MTSTSSVAQPPTFDQIVKKVEAKFEPADARPGQTVTLKISVQLINGWSTYPTIQPDKGAKAQTNKATFPGPADVVYVGELFEPLDPKEKSEPLALIEKLHFYPGGGVWERKAVVLPSTPAGKISSKIKFRVLVCDKDNCLPPKTYELEAGLNVAGEPVPVEKRYKDEVEKK